jgi:micrococcal nuclease
MARSRAVRVAAAAALLGSIGLGIGWGWIAGGRATAGTTVPVTVIGTIDGDTIVVRFADGHDDTVRLLGVDTPETHHPNRPVECFGPEASDYTHSRLHGRTVTLERDAQARDDYGRVLAYVEIDGQRFNDELLRLGYARLLIIPPNGAHGRAMLAAELDAQYSRRGLWGAC